MLKKETDQTTVDIHAMIRVNQAGEQGAVRIYQGQCAVLKKSPLLPKLQEMLTQEEGHLQQFNTLINRHRVRPTLLSPLWHAGAFALGAVTGLLGQKAALACTVAVEEVIDAHYQSQIDILSTLPSTAELRELTSTIETCQEEEVLHKNTALSLGAEQALGYKALVHMIKGISKTAIWLSTRL